MNLKSIQGAVDYWTKDQKRFYPWGFAMNGMTSRLETVRQIIFALKIERIVETGTFRGTTAEWFAQFGLPLETVEIIERYYEFSKRRLKPFPNAKITLASSVSYLKERVAKGAVPLDARQLFYLDSHWEKHLPLREELDLIFHNYTNSVAIIDDFEVADDDGYSFDAYSPQEQLTFEYILEANLPRSLCAFYPATKSSEETGARRGWIVLTTCQEVANVLRMISLLRER
jgi:hypothetical protein